MNTILPGLLNNDIEFFKTEKNELRFLQNGKIFPVKKLSKNVSDIIFNKITSEKKVRKELNKLFPNNPQKQLEKFLDCRYSNLNYSADFSDKHIQIHEYVVCPLRGNCKSEGILCKKFEFNGNLISDNEISIWKLITTSKTNEHISEIIGVCMGTFHKLKQSLYKKLGGIQTKQEATTIAFLQGII